MASEGGLTPEGPTSGLLRPGEGITANTLDHDSGTASKTVRGGGERIRTYLIVAALVVAMVAVAPAAAAGGGNSKWGKGLLSETLLFPGADQTSGIMFWSPETPEFVYDFHGYYLELGTYYTLICFEEEGEPGAYLDLGSKYPCDDEYDGVHIKGLIPWPCYDNDAIICLVPDTWTGFGGTEPPTLIAEQLIDI